MQRTKEYTPNFDSALLRKGSHYVVASDLYKANGAVLYFASSIVNSLLNNDYTYGEKGIEIDVQTELCAYIVQEVVAQDLFRVLKIESVKQKGSELYSSVLFISEMSKEGTTFFFKPLFASGSEGLVFLTDMLGEEISKILDERKMESNYYESLSPVNKFAYQIGLPML